MQARVENVTFFDLDLDFTDPGAASRREDSVSRPMRSGEGPYQPQVCSHGLNLVSAM